MMNLVMILLAFNAGVLALLGYMVHRMLRADGWDQSNITNALRLISHMVMHPEDYVYMHYLTEAQHQAAVDASPSGLVTSVRKPFWYVGKDELSEVVITRPPSNSVT